MVGGPSAIQKATKRTHWFQSRDVYGRKKEFQTPRHRGTIWKNYQNHISLITFNLEEKSPALFAASPSPGVGGRVWGAEKPGGGDGDPEFV